MKVYRIRIKELNQDHIRKLIKGGVRLAYLCGSAREALYDASVTPSGDVSFVRAYESAQCDLNAAYLPLMTRHVFDADYTERDTSLWVKWVEASIFLVELGDLSHRDIQYYAQTERMMVQYPYNADYAIMLDPVDFRDLFHDDLILDLDSLLHDVPNAIARLDDLTVLYTEGHDE